jgi:hypothetical protein
MVLRNLSPHIRHACLSVLRAALRHYALMPPASLQSTHCNLRLPPPDHVFWTVFLRNSDSRSDPRPIGCRNIQGTPGTRRGSNCDRARQGPRTPSLPPGIRRVQRCFHRAARQAGQAPPPLSGRVRQHSAACVPSATDREEFPENTHPTPDRFAFPLPLRGRHTGRMALSRADSRTARGGKHRNR